MVHSNFVYEMRRPFSYLYVVMCLKVLSILVLSALFSGCVGNAQSPDDGQDRIMQANRFAFADGEIPESCFGVKLKSKWLASPIPRR
jgi:hypothetical protein